MTPFPLALRLSALSLALLLACTALAAPCWAGEQHPIALGDSLPNDGIPLWTVRAVPIVTDGIRWQDEILEQRKQIDSLSSVVRRLERRLKAVEQWGGRYLNKRSALTDTVDVPPYRVSGNGDTNWYPTWAVLRFAPSKDHIDHVEIQPGGMEKSKARELAHRMILKWRLDGFVKAELANGKMFPLRFGQNVGGAVALSDPQAEDLLAEAIGTGRMKAEGDGK